MQKYRRVAYEDRCHISSLLQANFTVAEVCAVTGFHKSTIYRELKRNSVKGSYSAERASVQAAKRYKRCRRKKIITESVRETLRVYMMFGWSPQQIACRFKEEKVLNISHQTIYRSLRHRWLERKFLRRRRRNGAGRYSQIKAQRAKNRLRIHERPTIAEQRKRIGDWERDGMYGAKHKQLLVFTDRKSRFTKIKHMGTGNSKVVTDVTKQTLPKLGKKVFTITNDNGTEFSDSASLKTRTYFCDPRKPQQRGTVENTIGLLRQYIKRNTDLESLTENDLFNIENKINFRPRRCLGYKTPFEVFFNKKVALAMLI